MTRTTKNLKLPQGRALPKRKHKKIPPEEAKLLAAQNAERDKQSLKDAEAMWPMMYAPAYGDPLCLGEEFSDAAIRFAQRGMRWVEMAQCVGIIATDRRPRAELCDRLGYGHLEPANTSPFVPDARRVRAGHGAVYGDAFQPDRRTPIWPYQDRGELARWPPWWKPETRKGTR